MKCIATLHLCLLLVYMWHTIRQDHKPASQALTNWTRGGFNCFFCFFVFTGPNEGFPSQGQLSWHEKQHNLFLWNAGQSWQITCTDGMTGEIFSSLKTIQVVFILSSQCGRKINLTPPLKIYQGYELFSKTCLSSFSAKTASAINTLPFNYLKGI